MIIVSVHVLYKGFTPTGTWSLTISQSFLDHIQKSGKFWNLLVMRILKLSFILEIDEELTKIFKVEGKTQFLKKQ